MNGFINVSPECGPREPWHDIHMRVSGPIVLDILQNFRERWQRERRRIVDQDDLCSEISYDLDPKPTAIWNKLPIIMETKHETRWVTQLLRTIDDTSADFERQNFLEVDESEGCQIDQSIQQGVIEIIRNAQGFLYIENQYFTGSSKYWECEPKVEAKNPIPQEIV